MCVCVCVRGHSSTFGLWKMLTISWLFKGTLQKIFWLKAMKNFQRCTLYIFLCGVWYKAMRGRLLPLAASDIEATIEIVGNLKQSTAYNTTDTLLLATRDMFCYDMTIAGMQRICHT